MQTLESILIIAFTVLFIHATTWEGMINEWIHRVSFNWSPYLKKPLFDCPICMAPWWGGLIMLLGLIQAPSIAHGVMMLFAAGGVNTVLIYVISGPKDE